MSELNDLYQEVILDHGKRPRNFGKLEGSTCHAEGYNPLCGDRLTLYVKLEGETITDLKFEGSGCAISTASDSLMTEALKGKNRQEAEKLFKQFHQLVTTGSCPDHSLGKLEIFSGVAEFPTRVKCATLGWHTLKAALENKADPVSTDKGED